MQSETKDLFAPQTPEIAPIEAQPGLAIEEQAKLFHAANPHVYDAVVQIALAMKAKGWQRGGIGQIFERLRWLHAMRTQGSVYKLNNNYRAYYARLIMETVPVLGGFFELRRQRSAV